MSLEAELTELQRQLAQVDLLTRPRPRGTGPNFMEFLVLKLRNMKIKMYQETGHHSPHLHIDYGREHHVASYSIDDARRLEGSLDTKYDREVVAWIAKHRGTLLQAWTALQSGQDPRTLIAEIAGDA